MTTTGQPDGDTILQASGRFVPLSWYDRIVAATMREGTWRPQVVAEALTATRAAAAGGNVLEVGAGTGSLTTLLRDALEPHTVLTAVEPDADAVRIARAKAFAGPVEWIAASATELPVASASQDAVVVALVLHHLSPQQKLDALAETHRVLRPGGKLIVADFGPPQDPVMAAAFEIIRLADGRTTTAGHRAGIVAKSARSAGFTELRVASRVRTGLGSLELLVATRTA